MLMPEATMNEDDLLPARKYKVRISGKFPAVQTISIAKGADGPSNLQLGFAILASDARHVCTAPRRRQFIGHLNS
jgi:hypothetical protein